MYYSFLIHPSADGPLGCFHVLAIINSAAMKQHFKCLSIQPLKMLRHRPTVICHKESSYLQWMLDFAPEPRVCSTFYLCMDVRVGL